MMAECPFRHGMARARFFLQKAVACQTEQREECAAYLNAALLFARTALLRLGPTYGKHPDWKTWWKTIRMDTTTQATIEFLRHERPWIVHPAPAQSHPGMCGGDTPICATAWDDAAQAAMPATHTVEQYLKTMERLVLDAEKRFR